MSESIKALKALRDEAQEERLFQSTQHSDNAHVLWLSAAQMVSLCERAIASLEAERAERLAKAKDAGLVFADNGDRINEQFREMTDDLEAPADEQPKPSAEQAQQPEPKNFVTLPDAVSEKMRATREWLENERMARASGSTAFALADKAEQAQQPAYAPALTPFSQPIPVQPAPDALPTMIESIEANGKEWVRKSVFEAYQRECKRLQVRDKYRAEELVRIHTRANAAEQRAEQAERERDEARAELAGLKAQEPVATLYSYSNPERPELGRVLWTRRPVPVPYDGPLYAAPVPPPEPSLLTLVAECLRKVDDAIDGDRAETIRELVLRLKRCVDGFIPLAQHEAALAQARAEERERCAKACDCVMEKYLFGTGTWGGALECKQSIRALGGEAGE